MREVALEGCAVLLTTHQLGLAEEISDRVAIIQNGKIIAEESTVDIIKRFSGSTYIIEVEGELDQMQISKIEALGAIFEAGQIVYAGTKQGLYRVLTLLEPLPLLFVKQEQPDLTQIFLKLVREHNYV